NRLDQEPSVEFTVTYSSDTNLNEVHQVIEDVIDDVDLEDGTTYSFGGEQELLDDSIQSLAFAFVLALVFIYLVMAGQFESFKYPFVVMFSVPLIIIGIMIAFTVTQTPLSVTVFIGVIVLEGIVVNNGIVLIDYINQLRERGMAAREAIVEGVKQRTRPILMTALTTILGVIPRGLGFGEGSEIQQPMGIAVIGGLVSSTFLTIYIVPVLYNLLDKETRMMHRYVTTSDGQVIKELAISNIESMEEKRLEIQQPTSFDDEKILQEDITESDDQDKEKEESNNDESPEKEDKLTQKEIIEMLENIVTQSKDKEDEDK